jgi:hypothetical protein
MDWQGWFSLALVAGVLGTLTLTRLKPHVVMMGALTLLVTCGVLTGAEALAASPTKPDYRGRDVLSWRLASMPLAARNSS